MVVAIDMRVEGGELVERALSLLGDRLPAEMTKIALGASQVLAGEMRREIMARLNKGPKGELARSVEAKLLATTSGEVRAFAGSEKPYARVQNDGDPQHGINGAHLMAVPIKGAGITSGKWPRDWAPGELTLIPRRGKDPLLAVVGKDGQVSPKYVLKRSVSITGVHYREAALESGEPMAHDQIREELEQLVAQAGRGK